MVRQKKNQSRILWGGTQFISTSTNKIQQDIRSNRIHSFWNIFLARNHIAKYFDIDLIFHSPGFVRAPMNCPTVVKHWLQAESDRTCRPALDLGFQNLLSLEPKQSMTWLKPAVLSYHSQLLDPFKLKNLQRRIHSGPLHKHCLSRSRLPQRRSRREWAPRLRPCSCRCSKHLLAIGPKPGKKLPALKTGNMKPPKKAVVPKPWLFDPRPNLPPTYTKKLILQFPDQVPCRSPCLSSTWPGRIWSIKVLFIISLVHNKLGIQTPSKQNSESRHHPKFHQKFLKETLLTASWRIIDWPNPAAWSAILRQSQTVGNRPISFVGELALRHQSALDGRGRREGKRLRSQK